MRARRASSSPASTAASSISSRLRCRASAWRARSCCAAVSSACSADAVRHRAWAARYAASSAASDSPAKESSARRWAPAERRRSWSVWPCTATRCEPTSLSRPTGAARPPTAARERVPPPSEVVATVRFRTRSTGPSSSSASSTAPASSARASALLPAGTRSPASTTARRAPWRTVPASARRPSSRPSAVTTMVLPAPVSPVTTVKPGSSSTSAAEMTPRSAMRRYSITGVPPAVRRPDRSDPWPTTVRSLRAGPPPAGRRWPAAPPRDGVRRGGVRRSRRPHGRRPPSPHP